MAVVGLVAVDVVFALAQAWRRPPRIIDRATGSPVVERRSLDERIQIALTWRTVTGSRVLCRVPAFLAYLEHLSVESGAAMDHPESRERIAGFIVDNGVDTSDLDRDVDAFATLDEFFARPLRSGARPIAADPDRALLVSPADGRLLCYPELRLDDQLPVKGRRPDLRSLLAPVSRTQDGSATFSALVVRLAPGDYHRFHWPVDVAWSLDDVVDVPGTYHSVAPTAVSSAVDVFGLNRRTIVSGHSADVGPVTVVAVGAVKVGTIDITGASGSVAAGSELGCFRYGGSTVVVLMRADRVSFDDDLVEASARDVEVLVRMGERVGIAVPGTG